MTRKELSYIGRVVLGGVIHMALIVCALFNIEVVYELVNKHYVELADSTMFAPRVAAYTMSLSFFIASISGAFWVKKFYIFHYLPEVLDDEDNQ